MFINADERTYWDCSSISAWRKLAIANKTMTPHRYVVHLRLQAAIQHVRRGRMGLAEIAAETGFADQSHLSRWVRRVHGVTPSELA